jgi:hypothetical protein
MYYTETARAGQHSQKKNATVASLQATAKTFAANFAKTAKKRGFISCRSACGLASVLVHGKKKKQMLSRKRNGKTLHSWHFYAFLGALGVVGALGDYLRCFRVIRVIRG